MKHLYLKMHTNKLAWYWDSDTYGIIPFFTSQLKSGKAMNEGLYKIATLLGLKDNLDKIIIEKPNLKLIGENLKHLARLIIHMQRHFGMLIWILQIIFPDVQQEHLNIKKVKETIYNYPLTKDVQLSEARALLMNSDDIGALDLLCLHDTLCMSRYMKKYDI